MTVDEDGRGGHSIKLFKRKQRFDIKKFDVSSRVVDKWNSLSDCFNICIMIKTYIYIGTGMGNNYAVIISCQFGEWTV